ncbi:MAG: Ig-like domain-containing protein [Chloroflexota bacterium]|nr:Ig-like domain-containing protein [Chloroflexota bacterium]
MMRRIFWLVLLAVLTWGGAAGAQTDEPNTLRVVETLPADSSFDIPTNGVITVIFNRPVVPLTAIEAMESLPQPLRIEPATNGRGEWLNSAIYIFRPDPALAAGTEYRVTVDAGLTATDGAVLPEPYIFTFTTVAPAIVEVLPAPEATGVRLDEALQVTFNMPMDRASVASALGLVDAAGTRVAGRYEWNEDSTSVRFIPDALLALDTRYEPTIGTGALGAGGGASLETQSFAFITVPTPGVIRTDPFDGQTDAHLYGLTIYFASLMNPETLEDKFTITPEPWREPDIFYNDWDNSLTLNFPVEPSSEYTITMAAGAEDEYGNRIEQPLTIRYTTVPFDPDVSLQAPYGVGFYNARNPQTQVYLTHRNVSAIDLELYSVELPDFLPLLVGPNSYDPAQFFTPNRNNLLRSWQIPSVAPENARRYELLQLGGGGSVDCPGALPSRLRIGDTARVVSDPDPVRARATPGDGNIVTLLYRDYALPIIGGPQCINGVLWWQVQLREGEAAWVAEGVGEEYFLDVASASAQTPVTVTSESGALPPGIYLLSASTPETAAIGYNPLRHFLIVGTANLVFKNSVDSTFLWVTDVNSGLPIPNAPITIYDNDYVLVAQGTTDTDGILRLDLPRQADLYAPRLAVLNDGVNFGIGMMNWSSGIEGYDFAHGVDYAPEPYRAYVYTDRPIYRPGQPVYFRGIIRNRDDVTYTLPQFTEVPVQIFGGDDNALLYEATLPLTPFGTFSGQFDLAGDAPLGFYRIVAQLPRPNPDEYYGSEGTVNFQVAQYRAPEFQVTVTPDRGEVVQGETIRVVLDSRYFFGGVVSNATVEYRVMAQPYFFTADGYTGYSFVDFDYDAGASELYGGYWGEIASGSGTTDAEGRLIIEVPADLRDATQSLTYTIEATVTDESAQAVSGRTDVIVHKGEGYIGLRPQEYVAVAGEETGIDLVMVDWEGVPIAGIPLSLRVVERRWSSVMEEDDAGRTTWTWEVEDITVTDGSVMTDASGTAEFRFTPPAGGIYKVIAEARDGQGNTVIASTQVYASGSDYVVWRQQNSNRIDLIADQDEYQIGDTAEILIASPFQGAVEALVTVERGDVLYSERLRLTSNSTVYRLPITEDYAPNVYVSVFIVKGVDETNPVAAFRMGMVQLAVDTSQRVITLDIQPDRPDAGPGDTVTYTLRATDSAGNPVEAEVGVGLTDLSVLTIGDPNTISLLQYFFGQQGLGVRTSTALTINTDQLTQEVLDTIKGGGGGFGDGGIFDIRQEFVDTAYWNAALVTDTNGEATFSVTLPDNLTTWRLDARAVTRGADGMLLVGQETFDLISTKPLLIRPVTPRFFVVGDQAVVAAIVNNNTDATQTVEVSLLQADGVTLTSEQRQTVTIEAGQRARVEWLLTVNDAESVALAFGAQAGDLSDASLPPLGQGDARTLPVYRYDAPETVATAGALAAGETTTETISIPPELSATSAQAQVAVQPSLVSAMLNALDAFELSPRPSTEEVVSSFLPNVLVLRTLNAAGIEAAVVRAETETNLNAGLQALYNAQRVDGGWGWYLADESDPTVTAYALIGLSAARADGRAIDEGVIVRAQGYLRSEMIAPSLNAETWRLNRQAIMLYALAVSGAPDASRTAALYNSRERLSIYAQTLLAQTLAIIDPADGRAASLLDQIAGQAVVSATGTHWEEAERDPYNWNTDTRTTAMVLDTLLALRPQSELVPNVVRWLMSARTADGWESSQEAAWALMALARYVQVTGDYGFTAQIATEGTTVTIGGAAQALSAVGDAAFVAQVVPTDTPTDITIANNGLTTVYYTAQLNLTLPMAQVGALNRGIIVERRYTMGEGEDVRTVTGAQVGDTITVRLTIIAPNDLHYVIVEDPLPAGTDAVNPNLATSQQVGTQPELSATDPLVQGWGWWWFANIEFRDERVVLSSAYLPAGTYEFVYTIRAGLPGVYNVIPATAREQYFPEVFGRSSGAVLTIGVGE